MPMLIVIIFLSSACVNRLLWFDRDRVLGVFRSDSEDEPESEEDDSNPYPLEGKYVDEDDRNK